METTYNFDYPHCHFLENSAYYQFRAYESFNNVFKQDLLNLIEILSKCLPSDIYTNTYVAGGFVRDIVHAYRNWNRKVVIMPKDIDVFITNVEPNKFKILADLLFSGPNSLNKVGFSSVNLNFNSNYSWSNPIDSSKTSLAFNLTHPKVVLPIQIIFSTGNIVDTMEKFDWNLCQKAISFKDPFSIIEKSFDQSLKLNTFHDPLKTLKRGFYMMDKLQVKMMKEDLLTLTAALTLQEERYSKYV